MDYVTWPMQKYFPYHLEAMSSYASLNQRISDLICKILVLGISIWLACNVIRLLRYSNKIKLTKKLQTKILTQTTFILLVVLSLVPMVEQV